MKKVLNIVAFVTLSLAAVVSAIPVNIRSSPDVYIPPSYNGGLNPFGLGSLIGAPNLGPSIGLAPSVGLAPNIGLGPKLGLGVPNIGLGPCLGLGAPSRNVGGPLIPGGLGGLIYDGSTDIYNIGRPTRLIDGVLDFVRGLLFLL